MIAVADLLKGYYRDHEANPWHQIYGNIQSYWQKEFPKEDVSEILLLIREAVFGALGILSFGLVSEISTHDVLSIIINEASWNAGKRRVRNHCLDVAEELIANGEVRYLLPSALKRDDFSFLIPRIEEAQWENFLKAKPKITRGKLDLSKLEKSLLGSTFLREQMIMETKLSSDDPRVPVLLEAYELQMLEIEVNRSNRIQPPAPTEQVTLNGGIVQDIVEEKEASPKKRKQVDSVTPLMDFLEEPSKKTKKKTPEKPVKKSRGRQSK
jgi:hypothetical protein